MIERVENSSLVEGTPASNVQRIIGEQSVVAGGMNLIGRVDSTSPAIITPRTLVQLPNSRILHRDVESGAVEQVGLKPQISGSEKRMTYDLPDGESVAAELVLSDVGIAIGRDTEFRQIRITRTAADGTSAWESYWRTYRDSSYLEGTGKYPTEFFSGKKSAENFPGRVVEVAAGDGGVVDELKGKGVDAHGVDIWLSPLQREKDYFHFGFAEQTGLPNEWADNVFINHLLFPYYVEDSLGGEPSAMEKQILAESARILRPRGRLFIHPAWSDHRAHYEAMADGLPLTVPDLDIGINNPDIKKGPIIFKKAS